MSGPVHILQLVHSLFVGGTERVVCELVRAFNNSEIRTSVCCLDGLGEFGQELIGERVRVHVLNRKPGLDLSIISRLRQIYRNEKIDLIHAHQYSPYFYGAMAALCGAGVPVIFTEHGRHWPDRLRVRRAVVNQILRITTAAYTAVSNFSRESLIRYERIPAKAIEVIYNGIRVQGCGLDYPGRLSNRHNLGLANENILVLSVGRLDPMKDFATLIRSFAAIAEELPRALLWIAGDGDRDYKDQLLKLITRLGLSERVKLLGTRRDVEALLWASDLFVLPSITEASSVTILEAMAAERAVLATNTGGNPELVSHGETGMLVPVGDIAMMSKSLADLLKDEEKRVRLGRNGSRKVKDSFSLERTLADYRRLYNSIAGHEGGRSLRKNNLSGVNSPDRT
jgi:glycosyltransferase involved in cell wall biosynthesis